MKAIRVHPNPDASNPYSATNPASTSALVLDTDLPIPKAVKPGEIVVKVEATTIIRDALKWPETYSKQYIIPGNDFAGTVIEVKEPSSFKPGDEVFGMTSADRAGTWSEYAVVLDNEAALRPKSLTWAQAAALPLSGLTAYQALFEKAGMIPPEFENLPGSQQSQNNKRLLVLGASGGVGLYVVQLGRLAGLHVVAATRSNERNNDILKRLGADEIVEYKDLGKDSRTYDAIIDTVGGDALKKSWSLVKTNGAIVSIESLSYDFVEEHRKLGFTRGCENVQAIWFVVSPSKKDLEQLSAACNARLLETFVASTVSLAKVHAAYDGSLSMSTSRGKTVLIP